ncbi:MAG TPA: hypothetical protein VET69_00715, partial [Terriglobales bacterium]|nr:hypothetical protein [Terriglobales bacterium]
MATIFADRDIEITTTSVTGGPLLVRQFFYPGWTARDENGEWLSVRPSHPEGLTSITVPPGAHHVHLTLPWGNVELASWLISGLALLACAAGLKSGV